MVLFCHEPCFGWVGIVAESGADFLELFPPAMQLFDRSDSGRVVCVPNLCAHAIQVIDNGHGA